MPRLDCLPRGPAEQRGLNLEVTTPARARSSVTLVASGARGALTAQVATAAALFFTREIVSGSDPPYEQLRAVLDISGLMVMAVFFAWLLLQVAGGKLRPVHLLPRGAGITKRLGGYFHNLRPEYLTMFTTVTFLANLVAVGTAIGA